MKWLWRETPFLPFGTAHLATLTLFVILAAGMAYAGRLLRGSPWQLRASRALAIMLLVTQVPIRVALLLPRNWDLRYSLPLQICDIAAIIAVFALWTHGRWAFAIVYYWALTMTALAMLTPDLGFGFPHIYFLLFYLEHGLVVVSAAYLTWGVGLRPSWRLYRMILVVTAAYATGLFLFNRLADTNYMYLNAKPKVPTLLDYLGPHPIYVLVGAALACAIWAAMTWPWCRGKAS